VAKHKPVVNSGVPARGRGRPSNAELALRASLATQAVAPSPAPVESAGLPGAQEATAGLTGPPEPSVKPILPPAPPPPPPAPAPAPRAEQDLSVMSAADREDPRKLHGQALRDFAHARGAASRSDMEAWSDEKVREQVLMKIRRQYAEYA
jgi:hypothetical protein